jgi:DNA-binding transcriptional MerR regulator
MTVARSKPPGGYTVGDVAEVARVTVRTLHHYDEIGLLRPTARSGSAYRLYSDADLARLQQILFYRDLGFALDDVARILRDPTFDRRRALTAQRALVAAKRQRLDAMLALIDKTLDALDNGTAMKPEEMFEVFGDFDPHAHDAEVRERWGETPEFAESARRTRRYTKDDWTAIKSEGAAIVEDFRKAFVAGARPHDREVRAIAERARLHIDRWFYPCSRQMHAGLGRMYVDDSRFAHHYEKHAAGLAQFVCDAIRANDGDDERAT